MRRDPPSGTLALVTARSSNEKLGAVAATYAAQKSCPTDCVFFDGGGCYAEDGPVGKFVTAPLNRAAGEATALEVARFEAALIDEMEVVPGRPLRLHVVGDCSTDETANIVSRAAERYMERGGGTAWGYTHAWRVVERRSWGLVSVLASCESHAHVHEARARGYATALVVERFPGDRRYEWYADVHEDGSIEAGAGHNPSSPGAALAPVSIVPCPAQTRDIPCSDCRLCFDDGARLKAGVTIGFAIHGTPLLVRRATMALNDPENPDRRLSSRVLIPRFTSDFKRKHGRDPTGTEIARALDMSPSSVYEMQKSIRLGGPARPARRGKRRSHGR